MVRRYGRVFEHYVRVHVFQGREPGVSHLSASDALDVLERAQIEAVIVVVGHDEVGLVGASNSRQPHSIHVVHYVRCVGSCTAIGRRVVRLVAPPRIRGLVDTARATGRSRVVSNQKLQTTDLLPAVAGAVRIQTSVDLVFHGALSVTDSSRQ